MSGKSQRSQTRHGKNFRHHAAEPRRQHDVENEYERRRLQDDPSGHETKERRQPAGHDRPCAKNGSQDGSDIMGIKEEIIDGVAAYIGDTMDSNLNLFI